MTLTEPPTHLAGRPTVPWSWYSDPAILALETDRIFRGTWQYAGHLGELQGPGSYFASATGPVPVLVTLDGDGTLREASSTSAATEGRSAWPLTPRSGAPFNARITPGHTASTVACGPLRAGAMIPRLTPVAWGCCRCPSTPGGPSYSTIRILRPSLCPSALGDLPQVVAEHGLDVDSLRFNQRAHYEIRANWKIAIENYLECYHCPVSHPGFVEVVDDRRLELQAAGLRASQFAPAHPRSGCSRVAVRSTPGADFETFQFHLWFPNMKFNVYPGEPNLSIGPLWPTDPVTSAGYLDYFFADTTGQEWIDDLFELDNQVGAEDIALVEAAQRGSSVGIIERGWVLGGAQTLIGHFRLRSRPAGPGQGLVLPQHQYGHIRPAPHHRPR